MFKHLKKWNQTKSRNLLQMCIFCLLSFLQKGGKIQAGLNCEYDGLSEVMLSLSHSNDDFIIIIFINFLFSFSQESISTLLQYLTFKSNVFTNTKDSFWTFSILSPCTTVLKPILKTKTLCPAQLWWVARLPLGKLNSKISNSFKYSRPKFSHPSFHW